MAGGARWAATVTREAGPLELDPTATVLTFPVVFGSGYWSLGRILGVPVRAHWSVLLGALLFGGLRFAPIYWLGFVALVLVHEMGHAVLARALGHRVVGVELNVLGGLCRYTGNVSPVERSIVAWGGVLGQALLFLVGLVLGLLAVAGVFQGVALWAVRDLVSVLVGVNAFIAVLNLIPLPPFDGAEAWRLFSRVRRDGLPRSVKGLSVPRSWSVPRFWSLQSLWPPSRARSRHRATRAPSLHRRHHYEAEVVSRGRKASPVPTKGAAPASAGGPSTTGAGRERRADPAFADLLRRLSQEARAARSN